MITIGKLREHSAWVVGAIGVALLGFLVSEAYQSGRMGFGDYGPKPIAEIWGEKISADEFRIQYEQGMNVYKSRMKADEVLSPAMEGQLNDQLWYQYSREKVLEKEYHELGIEVSGEEVKEAVAGAVPDQMFVRVFSDPKTGQYNRGFALQFINQFDKQSPQNQQQWMEIEKEFVKTRLQNKYNTCIKSGLYATDLEAKDAFYAGNKVFSVEYVQLALNSIDDKQITVADDEIQAYINKHKDEYKREETRGIDFVSFDIIPTQEDTMQAKQWMDNQLEAFKLTKNDSSFVTKRGSYSPTWQHRGQLGTLPEGMEERILASDSGTIIGPEYKDGTFRVIKVAHKKRDTIAVYHAAHILYKTGGKAGAKDSVEAMNMAVADMQLIKKGGDFGKLAGDKSDDGSGQKQGDLGWSPLAQWVKPFADAVKGLKKGEMTITRSEFGVHLIKLIDAPSYEAVRYAVLERKVEAGSKTRDKASNAARDLRVAVQNPDDFEKVIRKKNLNKKTANDIKPNDKFLPGIENARELVRWVHEHKKGEVSDPLISGNNSIVVAKIIKESHEGTATVEDVKEQVTPIVRNEKKKDKLAEKMKEALEKSKNLDAIATSTKGTKGAADNLNLNNTFMQQAGNEPKVVGYASAMKTNKVSKVIIGDNGVYVVMLKNINNISAPAKMDSERNNLMRTMQAQGINEAATALQDKANVKDYRYYYF